MSGNNKEAHALVRTKDNVMYGYEDSWEWLVPRYKLLLAKAHSKINEA